MENKFKPTIIQKTSPSKPPNPFNSQQKSQEVPTPFKPLYKIPNSPIQIASNKDNSKETNILIVNHTNHDRYVVGDSVPSTACVSEISVSPETNNHQPVVHHIVSTTSSRFSSRESSASSRKRKKPVITAQQFKNMVEEKKKDNDMLIPKIESPPSPQQPKVITPPEKKINVRLIHEYENQENESFISSIDHVSPINKQKNVGAYSDIYGMPKKKNEADYDVESVQKDPGYAKSKKEITYKPYSMNDYNKIKSQGNIKLGGLGADLQNEQLLEKKEKASKMKEYAKEISQLNNNKIKKQKTPTTSQPTPQEIEAAKLASVREKALEFASKIPKPKPKKKCSGSATADAEPEPLSELEMLELQHERDREWLKKEFATR